MQNNNQFTLHFYSLTHHCLPKKNFLCKKTKNKNLPCLPNLPPIENIIASLPPIVIPAKLIPYCDGSGNPGALGVIFIKNLNLLR